MNRIAILSFVIVCAFSLQATFAADSILDVYAPPKLDEVRKQVLSWLTSQSVDETKRAQIESMWTGLDETLASDRVLELLVQTFAIVDRDVLNFVRECNSAKGMISLNADFLKRPGENSFFVANMRLFQGRCLVEHRLFDEAFEVLKHVDARQVVDPASLFFFQAVAAQGMLELKPALEAIDQLLTNTERVPVRYSTIASLMQADLKALREKSLGEIARLMSDSERRLELGRTGEKVQEVQERIISNLDEIIKKTEQQQQQSKSQGGGDGSGNDNNPAGGADDSRVKGSEAPGEVDKKNFDNKGSWGDLPPKDLTKVKNDLNKNFPSHYEQAIEKYTKKLAGRTAKKK